MSTRTASKLFENYANLPSHVPDTVWRVLRGVGLAVTAGIILALIIAPDLGLKLFWGLAIPVLPAVFAVVPGLWRQLCPMAALNQIPRGAGFSLGRELPAGLQNAAYAIAVATFLAFVGLRVPLFNHAAGWLALGLVAALVIPFFGGLVFKGRSGWCGTFCPLGPVQRFYGQSPPIIVRNGYCPTCVGCQKNCYDFSPASTIFSDLHDDDHAYVGQRRFFMAMMPGVLCGYFLQGPNPPYGEPLHAIIFIGAALVSTGVYQAATTFFKADPLRMATLFACLSLIIYYAFAGPTFVTTVGSLAGIAIPAEVADTSRVFGVLVALALFMQARQNGAVYRKAMQAADTQRVTQQMTAQRERVVGAGQQVVDRGSGVAFAVGADQSLLDAMEAAGVEINFGCRSGVCGADPVAIAEGAENLSAAEGDEVATLRRLGLKGKARLACCCRVTGPVTIDRDLKNATPFEPIEEEVAQKDLAALGIRRVVIIGNGAAGLGVAEGLRRVSQDVEITVVADEFHHFYNRMAIGRVVYGRTAMDGLQLLPDEWYAANKIEVWRNTVVSTIGRRAKLVRLATGDALTYDRLVLAMGARSGEPAPNFSSYPNAFMLRSAADAQAIRACIQTRRVRRAVVIGGGVLGIEAADALHHLGVEVTILQRAKRLMDAQLDDNGAAHLAEYLADIHIRAETGVSIASLEAEATLKAVCLADGRKIEADLFVACAGIVPNTELAKECGLEVGRGILVDAAMRTTRDPSIYAVGDVAQAPHGPGGLWTIAAAQAKTAVANMIGDVEPYAPSLPIVQLKCDGIDVRSFGEIAPKTPADVVEAPPHGEAWWRFVLRDGALVGALYVGPPGSSRDFTRVIQGGLSIAPVLDELRAGRIGALRELLGGARRAPPRAAAAEASKDEALAAVDAPDSTLVPANGDASATETAPWPSARRATWAAAAVLLVAILAGGYWAWPGGGPQAPVNPVVPNPGPKLVVADAPPPVQPVAPVRPVPPPADLTTSPPAPSPQPPPAVPVRPDIEVFARPPTTDKPTVLASPSPPVTPPTVRVDSPPLKPAADAIEPNLGEEALYKRGQELARNGDFARAIRYFDEAIRLDPRHADALNNRCWARAVVGELQAALSDCDQALLLRPRYADALDSRGLVHLKLGMPTNALTDFNDALRINPKLASSLFGRGVAKLRTGNPAGGQADIAAAKAISPGVAEDFAKYGIR